MAALAVMAVIIGLVILAIGALKSVVSFVFQFGSLVGLLLAPSLAIILFALMFRFLFMRPMTGP